MISARSESLEIKNNLQQISADLEICKQKLQVLLNTETVLLPADSILHRIDFLPDTYDSVSIVNPMIGFVNQQVEVARMEKKLENSRALPELSIGYFSQTMQGIQEVNGVPRVFSTGNRFTGVQAGIAIPIWFSPYSAKVKAAKLKEKIAQTDAESYSKSVFGNYRSLMLELSKNSNNVDFYEKQAIPEADLIIDQATLSFKAGAIDYMNYIQTLRRALSIKQNYLEALNNYNQTIISIDFITGKIF